MQGSECFDLETGLWKFKSVSKHCARQPDDKTLERCIQQRDSYSDQSCGPRTDDGCLQGPDLIVPLPETTCPCKVCNCHFIMSYIMID